MNRVIMFIKTNFLIGVGAFLPIVLVIWILYRLWCFLVELCHPLVYLSMRYLHTPQWLSSWLVLFAVLLFCLCLGRFIRTRYGARAREIVDNRIFKYVPLYTKIRDIVVRFMDKKKALFSDVAMLVFPESEIAATVFITDEHGDHFTIFLPTGPNPTTGLILYAPKNYVRRINVPADEAMRTIISCGSGGCDMLKKLFGRPGAGENPRQTKKP